MGVHAYYYREKGLGGQAKVAVSASAGVQYDSQRLYIKQILDHREYDKGHWKE
jgi:mRNA-degrading endonuclease HigB of HigAB toxin-antitoxin module